MLTPVEKILFFCCAVASLYLAQRFFRQAARIIQRGEGKLYFDQLPRRIWRAFDVTFTQRTVFRTRLRFQPDARFHRLGLPVLPLVNVGDVIEGYFDVDFLGTGLIGDLYRLVGDVLSVVRDRRDDLFPDPALCRERSRSDAFTTTSSCIPDVRRGIRRDSLIVGAFILIHVGGRFLGETFWIARHGSGSLAAVRQCRLRAVGWHEP